MNPTLQEVHSNWHLLFDHEVKRLREGFDVQLLWAAGYYDGPASGVCTHAGKNYWFDRMADVEYRGLEIANSLYIMVELTDAEFSTEKAINDLFRKHVGEYCNYTYKSKIYEGDDEPTFSRVRGEFRVEDTKAGYEEFSRLRNDIEPSRDHLRYAYREKPVACWWASER